MQLQGKTFIVTGGSSGLGAACVMEFARAGANNRFDSQSASALGVDGADQLRALAAAQGFAVQNHDIAVLPSMTAALPGPEGLLEFQNPNRFEHAVNTIFRRHLVALGFAVEPAACRRSLGWS